MQRQHNCAHRYRGSRAVDVVDGDDIECAVDVGVRPELAQLRDVVAVDRERPHLDTPNHLCMRQNCRSLANDTLDAGL